MALNITIQEHQNGWDVSVEKNKEVPEDWVKVDDTITQEPKFDILYDKNIQPISLIQANVVEIFDKWFRSFFPSDYFKDTRISTESTFSEFKSLVKTIYKKEQPFLLIDPNSMETNDDFIFATNMINRHSRYDPETDCETGMKLMYSLTLLESDKIAVMYRRNRFTFRFDIMIMERSVPRRDDLYHFLIMNMRHKSKFTLERRVAVAIPLQMMVNVAIYHGLDIKSNEFVQFINSISTCPIEKRTSPNGKTRFYAHQEAHIYVDVPDMPSRDSAEKSNAIEIGARLTDSFALTVDLPSEFISIVPRKLACDYNKIEDDYDQMFYINNDMINPNIELSAPKIIGDNFQMFTKCDLEFSYDDKNTIHLLEIIDDLQNEELSKNLRYAVSCGVNIEDILRVKLYNKEYEVETTLNDDATVTISNNKFDYRFIYTLFIYINFTEINKAITMHDVQTIGTVKVDL